MTCQSARELISPFIDSELETAQAAEVEEHIRTCIACAERQFEYLQLRTRVRADARYYSASEELRSRIERTLQQKAAAHERWRAPWGWIGSAAAAGFAAALLLVFVLAPNALYSGKAAPDLIAQEVVSSHVRSLMAGHLIDVRSSDQHTVKPWFAGKLALLAEGQGPRSPRLRSYRRPARRSGRPACRGTRFRTAATRDQPVCLAIVEAIGESSIDVCDNRLQHRSVAGSGLTYWAVSDLNAAELREFARLYSE